jgi:cell division septation protein DedD
MTRIGKLTLALTAALMVGGCQDGAHPFAFLKKGGTQDSATTADAAPAEKTSVRLVDRDVEAPDLFQVTDKGLWDGRPSLGGVWVAYPGVKDPERVIIRNPSNGKFVVGALFRRELNNPGPKLQLSSDAAAALGLVAGEPSTISVTALRREETKVPEPDATKPALAQNEQIQAKPLADVTATASAAIDNAQGKATAKATPEPTAAPAAKPAPKPAVAATSGAKSWLQIGIFSVEANANRAAGMISKAGGSAQVKAETTQGKTFWRVIAGPVGNAGARTALKEKAVKLGFKDAFFVKG